MFQCQRVASMSCPLANGRGELRWDDYVQWNGVLAGPEHNYRELSLELVADRRSDVHAVMLRKGYARSAEVSMRAYSQLEVRADLPAQKFWVVDRGAGRVIGTLDAASRTATSSEEPTPAWASPDTGTVLTGTAVSSARRGGT